MSLPIQILADIRIQSGARAFIETGTHTGGGVRVALEAGFTQIHSIELSRPFWLQACMNVGGEEGVYLYLGDSGRLLKPVLELVDERAVIFLDGHTVPGIPQSGVRSHPYPKCPLLDELTIIKRFQLAPHVLLIDDWDMLGTPVLDNIPQELIREMLTMMGYTKLVLFDGARPLSLLIAEP